MRVVSKYEVWCPACGVSYPPGQKKCVHCGGRTAKKYVELDEERPEFTEGIGAVEHEPAVVTSGEGREIVFLPTEGADEGMGEVRGGWIRRIGGLVWIILFVLLTAVRMCSEGDK